MDETEDNESDDSLPTVYMKRVVLSGATFWHSEQNFEQNNENENFDTGEAPESFYESPPESPPVPRSEENSDGDCIYSSDDGGPPPLIQAEAPPTQKEDKFALVGEMMGSQEVKVRIQPREGNNVPKLSLDLSLQAITFLLCPKQIHSILNLIKSLSDAAPAQPEFEKTIVFNSYLLENF